MCIVRHMLVLSAALLAFAPQVFGQAGAFTRMGFGARGIALSNALVADPSGEGSAFYNPALAPGVTRQSLEASAALLTLDRELQFLQFAAPLKPRAGMTAGLIHAGVSNIDGRDESGYHTRDYATDEFAFFMAFGVRLSSRVTGGFGLQLFRADYVSDLEPVQSIGLDIGLTAQVTDVLKLGVTVDDLLARYEWDTSDLYGQDGRSTLDPFPTRLRVGASYTLMEGRVLLLGEYEARLMQAERITWTTEQMDGETREVLRREAERLHDSLLRFGAEYRLAEPFAVRAGIDRIGTGTPTPSAGFMLQQPIGNLLVRAEYAFRMEPYDTQAMHVVALRIYL